MTLSPAPHPTPEMGRRRCAKGDHWRVHPEWTPLRPQALFLRPLVLRTPLPLRAIRVRSEDREMGWANRGVDGGGSVSGQVRHGLSQLGVG